MASHFRDKVLVDYLRQQRRDPASCQILPFPIKYVTSGVEPMSTIFQSETNYFDLDHVSSVERSVRSDKGPACRVHFKDGTTPAIVLTGDDCSRLLDFMDRRATVDLVGV